MIEFVIRNRKWFLGTFVGIVLFFIFVLPQFWKAYSDFLDKTFASISVKATPQFSIPSTEKYFVSYQSNPFKIKVIDWIHVQITWPDIDNASEYMLRSGKNEYPASILNGSLVYQGEELTIIDQRSTNIRYTLFYKDADDNWVIAYRGHIEG